MAYDQFGRTIGSKTPNKKAKAVAKKIGKRKAKK